MKLTWYGHSCFLLETAEGSVVFDPYAPGSVPGLKLPPLRADLVLAKVYNLSRNAASELFTQGRVFVNGRMLEHGSYELDFGEIVSVRGHGRFWLAEDRGLSRKGKRNLTVYRT